MIMDLYGQNLGQTVNRHLSPQVEKMENLQKEKQLSLQQKSCEVIKV